MWSVSQLVPYVIVIHSTDLFRTGNGICDPLILPPLTVSLAFARSTRGIQVGSLELVFHLSTAFLVVSQPSEARFLGSAFGTGDIFDISRCRVLTVGERSEPRLGRR